MEASGSSTSFHGARSELTAGVSGPEIDQRRLRVLPGKAGRVPDRAFTCSPAVGQGTISSRSQRPATLTSFFTDSRDTWVMGTRAEAQEESWSAGCGAG